ncbi:MAG: hypothetical protein V3R57_07725 [Candidatus Bathyarchaeia archaeon]
MKFFTGLLFGCLITALFIGLMWAEPWIERDRERLQNELNAYRMCMLTAALHRCQMTPEDFVRYWEIKHLLEEKAE